MRLPPINRRSAFFLVFFMGRVAMRLPAFGLSSNAVSGLGNNAVSRLKDGKETGEKTKTKKNDNDDDERRRSR